MLPESQRNTHPAGAGRQPAIAPTTQQADPIARAKSARQEPSAPIPGSSNHNQHRNPRPRSHHQLLRSPKPQPQVNSPPVNPPAKPKAQRPKIRRVSLEHDALANPPNKTRLAPRPIPSETNHPARVKPPDDIVRKKNGPPIVLIFSYRAVPWNPSQSRSSISQSTESNAMPIKLIRCPPSALAIPVHA